MAKKKMSLAGKIFISSGVLVLLLVVAVVAVPFVFKDKINEKVKEEINNQANAKVDYSDYSLSLIRSFPNFSFSLSDLSVVGTGVFKGDTLLSIKNFSFTVDLMTVLKGERYKLIALQFTDPVIHAQINYEGKANWDIMKPSPTKTTASEPVNFSLEIKKYKIENGEVTYDDKVGNSFAQIHDLDFEGSGNVADDIYDLITKTSIAELTYKSGAVAYLSKAKLNAEMNLSVDNLNSKYAFKENSVTLNDLALQFDGFVQNRKEEMSLDVKFKSKQTEFKSILSLVPAVYKKDFDKVKTSGSLALEGFVKGQYSDKTYPAVNLNLKVNNGMFQYPDLPVAVKNIFIAANVSKPQGDLDFTVVDISKLHLEAGSDPVDAKINIKTPVSDPNVSANITGKLNLANVPRFYPMEGLKTLSGLLSMNLDFKGRKSDVDKKNYEAVKAAGSAKVSNLVYDSKETPMPVRVMDMQMTFSPKNVTVSSFSSAIGKSDFNATGTLDNFMAYAFGKGDLVGNVNLRSSQFDANEWLRKDETTIPSKTDTAKTEYFKVPAHIDFTANSLFGKILYEKLVLENVKGKVTVKDEVINLNELFANLLGGNATISARYNTKGKSHPDVTFTYDINNFDIQKTYQSVGMSEKMAPVMKYIQGNFSSDLKGSGKLNEDMSVDYNSLTGDGKVEIPSARIVGLPILTKITEVAKIPALQNLEMKNAWTVLKFKDGRVAVDPTDLKFGNGYNVNVQGSNGFDQSIDYDMRMDIPSKELGAATSLAQGYLSKVPGLGNVMPDIISFVFKVTGTTAKPQVKLSKVLSGGTSTKDIITNAAEDLKKKAEEEAKKQADELKKKAEDEINKQKAELERKAREAADKAKKEAADKLKDMLKFPR
ncbi:MAG: AsmA-like C-terminal region-containing protein [Chitinophagales bacterium]